MFERTAGQGVRAALRVAFRAVILAAALVRASYTPRCIFDNVTAYLNLRDGSMQLYLWPDPDRLDECSDYAGDLEVSLKTPHFTAQELFAESDLSAPQVFKLPCPASDYEDCTEKFNTISTASFTITRSDSSAGSVSLTHYVNAVRLMNFEYDNCWTMNSLFYSRGTLPMADGTPQNPGICFIVTPTGCKIPGKVDVSFHFYGDGDVMDTFHINASDGLNTNDASGASRYNYEKSQKGEYNYTGVYRYCYSCTKEMFKDDPSGASLDHCSDRMAAIMASDTLHAVMELVAYPDDIEGTLKVPFYARTYSQRYESYRFPNCFEDGELFISSNRLAIGVKPAVKKDGTVDPNCVFPDGQETYYNTIYLDLFTDERDPNNSEFFYRMTHQVTNFDFVRNRYWFLCNGNTNCLNALAALKPYLEQGTLFVRSGILIYDYVGKDEDQSLEYVDEVSFNVPQQNFKYSCFGSSSAQFTSNGIVIKIFPNQDRECPQMLDQQAAYVDVVLWENAHATLEQLSKTLYGHFAIPKIAFTLGDVITVTCSDWLSADDDPGMAGLDCGKQLAAASTLVKSHRMVVEVGIYQGKEEVGTIYDRVTSINTVYWQNMNGVYIGMGICLGLVAVASVVWSTIQILKYKRLAVMDR